MSKKKDLYINHYTINTTHNRRSPCSEVSDEAIATLVPWIQRCLGRDWSPLPWAGFEHIEAKLMADSALICTLRLAGSGIPLLTFAVVTRSQHSRKIWGLLTNPEINPSIVYPDNLKRPEAPWLGVLLYSSYVDDSSFSWLADFERCCAWAWMRKSEFPSTATH